LTCRSEELRSVYGHLGRRELVVNPATHPRRNWGDVKPGLLIAKNAPRQAQKNTTPEGCKMKRGVMRGRRVWTVLLAIAFIGYFAAPALAAPHRGINNCGDFCLVVERDGSWHTSALFHIYSDGSAETIWLLGNEVGSVTYFEIHNRTTTAARAMVHWGDIDGEGSQNTAYAARHSVPSSRCSCLIQKMATW